MQIRNTKPYKFIGECLFILGTFIDSGNIKQITGYHNKQRHMKRISYLLEEHRTFMVIRIKGR